MSDLREDRRTVGRGINLFKEKGQVDLRLTEQEAVDERGDRFGI